MQYGTWVPDIKIMEWLGIAGGVYGYHEHHDPHWAPPDRAERIGEHAATWDRTRTSGWETENATKFNAAVLFYSATIGAAWWLLQDDTRSLTVGTKTLTGEDAVDWCLEALDAWESPRAFFNAVQAATEITLRGRRLVQVAAAGTVSASTSGATLEATWSAWRSTDYAAALAEGKRKA